MCRGGRGPQAALKSGARGPCTCPFRFDDRCPSSKQSLRSFGLSSGAPLSSHGVGSLCSLEGDSALRDEHFS